MTIETHESTLSRIDTSLATAARGRVLMLTHRVPWPLDRGDRIRAYHILKYLSERFNVALACVTEQPLTLEQRRKLFSFAEPLAVLPIEPVVGKLRGAAALALGRAATPAYFYRSDLARTIRRWHLDNPFDAVFTYCTAMAHYAHHAFLKYDPVRPRHIIDLVDVDSVKWNHYAQSAAWPMRSVYAAEARRLRRIEADEHDYFDAITVVSDTEAALYRQTVGDHPGLTVLRHGVDTDYFQPGKEEGASRLVFVGNLGYKPNVDGIVWFVEHVWPKLRQEMPQAILHIVGRDPSEAVSALGGVEGVRVVGPVRDVRSELAEATVAIAPLRIGCGVQTKVLEAMAAGRAVVCSPAAAKGILAHDGEHLLVAESPTQWAERIRRLLTNDFLRHGIASAARQLVERIYAWETCLAPLQSLITGRVRPQADAQSTASRRAA